MFIAEGTFALNYFRNNYVLSLLTWPELVNNGSCFCIWGIQDMHLKLRQDSRCQRCLIHCRGAAMPEQPSQRQVCWGGLQRPHTHPAWHSAGAGSTAGPGGALVGQDGGMSGAVSRAHRAACQHTTALRADDS